MRGVSVAGNSNLWYKFTHGAEYSRYSLKNSKKHNICGSWCCFLHLIIGKCKSDVRFEMYVKKYSERDTKHTSVCKKNNISKKFSPPPPPPFWDEKFFNTEHGQITPDSYSP